MRTLLRRLWHALHRRRFEHELDEELAFHLDMKRRAFESSGLDPEKAAARARREVGNLALTRNHARDVWLWPSVQGLSLDVRLGLRMLVRYPGLTVVGGLALAFGIWAGAGGFEIRTQMVNPAIPLDEGDRIVGVRNWNVDANRSTAASADDFITWRNQLERLDEVGAFRLIERNLIVEGRAEVAAVAEMTASGFTVARIPPLLGRTIIEADEQPDAAPVVVVGYGVWQRRFFGDADIIGRSVALGDSHATIVGVMPDGFSFPAVQAVWIPLRRDRIDHAGQGPALAVFGRLAPGATFASAQAELDTIGRRAAADEPETHAFVRPQLVPFASLVFDPSAFWLGLALANVFLVMLLALVCTNVALLMFARAAGRETEIAVRNALGATRGRIVSQLFVEALVLAGVAVAAGLAAARVGLRSFWSMYEADSGRSLPFWFGDHLTSTTVLYAAVLTVAGAVIIGVLPAVKATESRRQARLRESTAASPFRFGGVWTVVVVVQVAATVAFPAAAFSFHRWVVEGRARDVGVAAEQFLAARLDFDRDVALGSDDTGRAARVRSAAAELRRRLLAEPDVTGATFADRLPGTLHPRWVIQVEGDDGRPEADRLHRVASAAVDVDFFETMGTPIVGGRTFSSADLAPDAVPVVVNQSFVSEVLDGRNPVGRRLSRITSRDSREPHQSFDVVGVVRDLGMVGGENGAGLYRPLSPGLASQLRLAVHVRGDPVAFAARLREMAGQIDPTLRVADTVRLDEAGASLWLESQYLSRLLAAMSAVAMLLSLTAIYSIMSFTVSQRTREIGVRLALGAEAGDILRVVLRGPLAQIGAGVGLGATLVVAMSPGLFGGTPTLAEAAMLGAYALLAIAVCLLSCVLPTLRALSVDPAEVLRADG